MTFVHRGITINFDQKIGDFSATVAGQVVKKQSLAAIRKHIDANWKKEFKPFKAMMVHNYRDEATLEEVMVTGILNPRGRYQSATWLLDGYSPRNHVAELTATNVKRIRQYLKMKEDHEKLIEKMADELHDLKQTIVLLSPTDPF